MKTGFIGCGNMAKAIISGILKSGFAGNEDVLVYDISPEARAYAENELMLDVRDGNISVALDSDILVLAIKPVYMAEVIAEIRDSVPEDALVITLAPGKTHEWLARQFERPVRLVRIMPNTPAMAGEGITALCPNELVSDEELAKAVALCESFGQTEIVPEKLIDVVSAVSGSSPAFVFMFIEALADGAVAEGMSRQAAYKFAAQTVLGSAKLMQVTGKHPGELTDMVCSPGGTTIEGEEVLEEMSFRGAVAGAVRACVEKSKNL